MMNIRERELNFIDVRLGAIGTQAALCGGFMVSSLKLLSGEKDNGEPHSDFNFNYDLKVLFPSFVVTSQIPLIHSQNTTVRRTIHFNALLFF